MVWYRTPADEPQRNGAGRLSRAMGSALAQPDPLALALGHLHLLWSHAATCAEDGIFQGYTVEDLEAAARWTGAPGALAAALEAADFIVSIDGGFALLDWDSRCELVLQAKQRQSWRDQKATRRALLRQCPPDSPGHDPDTTRTPADSPVKSGPEKEKEKDTDPPKPPKGGSATQQAKPAEPPEGTTPRLVAAVVEQWNKGRHGNVPAASVNAEAKVRDDNIRKMLKAYPTAKPESFYWIAKALSADDHHQRWGKATLSWVVKNKPNFEKCLERGRALFERVQRAKQAKERYERELKETEAGAQAQGARSEPDHAANAERARTIRQQLRRQLGVEDGNGNGTDAEEATPGS